MSEKGIRSDSALRRERHRLRGATPDSPAPLEQQPVSDPRGRLIGTTIYTLDDEGRIVSERFERAGEVRETPEISGETRRLLELLCFYEREYARLMYARPHNQIEESAAEDRRQDAYDDFTAHVSQMEQRLEAAEKDRDLLLRARDLVRAHVAEDSRRLAAVGKNWPQIVRSGTEFGVVVRGAVEWFDTLPECADFLISQEAASLARSATPNAQEK